MTPLEVIPCLTGSESRSTWSEVQSSTDCAMANPLDATVLYWTGRPWSPYLGRLATVSMTVEDSFVRRAKTSTVTPIFFFLISKRNVSGRFWRFLKKILGTVFLLKRFGVVNPWTCNWNTYKSLQKTVVFDLGCWKNEHGDPQFLSHIWNSHETKDRYWKNQPNSR